MLFLSGPIHFTAGVCFSAPPGEFALVVGEGALVHHVTFGASTNLLQASIKMSFQPSRRLVANHSKDSLPHRLLPWPSHDLTCS
jgi:hypothetical protein